MVVPRSRMHPGFIDDTLAAGSFGAITRYVGLRDALRRGAYANVSGRAVIRSKHTRGGSMRKKIS